MRGTPFEDGAIYWHIFPETVPNPNLANNNNNNNDIEMADRWLTQKLGEASMNLSLVNHIAQTPIRVFEAFVCALERFL